MQPHAELSGCTINSCTKGNVSENVGKYRTSKRKGACVMDDQGKYIDRGSLEVTMQNGHLVNKAY